VSAIILEDYRLSFGSRKQMPRWAEVGKALGQKNLPLLNFILRAAVSSR
jgi:hypothetical protein